MRKFFKKIAHYCEGVLTIKTAKLCNFIDSLGHVESETALKV